MKTGQRIQEPRSLSGLDLPPAKEQFNLAYTHAAQAMLLLVRTGDSRAAQISTQLGKLVSEIDEFGAVNQNCRPSQLGVILGFLDGGQWIPLFRIMGLGIAQHGARFNELRRRGYVIENRHTMLRSFPDLLDGIGLRGIDDYGMQLGAAMREIAPAGCSDPQIVHHGAIDSSCQTYIHHVGEASIAAAESRNICVPKERGDPVEVIAEIIDKERT